MDSINNRAALCSLLLLLLLSPSLASAQLHDVRQQSKCKELLVDHIEEVQVLLDTLGVEQGDSAVTTMSVNAEGYIVKISHYATDGHTVLSEGTMHYLEDSILLSDTFKLSNVNRAHTHVSAYKYNKKGKVKSLSFYKNGSKVSTIKYKYDRESKLKQTTQRWYKFKNHNNYRGTGTRSYKYDKNGNAVRIIEMKKLGPESSIIETRRIYDDNGRCTAVFKNRNSDRTNFAQLETSTYDNKGKVQQVSRYFQENFGMHMVDSKIQFYSGDTLETEIIYQENGLIRQKNFLHNSKPLSKTKYRYTYREQ